MCTNGSGVSRLVVGCESFFFWRVIFLFLSARRAGRISCVAALKAASEVERSGTER
jgi:hypothetical protein